MVAIWGTTWAVIRVGLQGAPPFAGLGLRFLLAGAVLFCLGVLLGVPSQRGRRLYRLWVIETVFGFSITYGVVYWAEQVVPSGLASVLFSTFPLFVALLAHLWLPNEPLRLASLLGIAVALGGVAVLFSDDFSLPNEGARWVAVAFFASPIAAAVAHVLMKRWGSGVHPVNLVTVPMLATGGLMALASIWLEAGRPLVLDAVSVSAIVYLAIPGSVVTFTLYYWTLDRVPATRLSLITLAIPVVAVGVGALFLDEPLSGRTGAGAALVLLGVGLALRGTTVSAGDRGATN